MTKTPPNDTVRQSIEALRDSDPRLHEYIQTLESEASAEAARAGVRRKAGRWAAGAGLRMALGGDLSDKTRVLTGALDAWMAREPGSDGVRQGFPTDEAGQVVAAAFGRFVRVSFVGLLVAVLPTTILVIQTALMFQQNAVIQQQLNVQIDETRQSRRAQFISTLFDPAEGCDEVDRAQCLPRASGPARAEAARALAALARESGLPVDLSGAPLDGVRLGGARFEGVRLAGARFESTDLSGANLAGADLTGAFMDKARMEAANLSGANLVQAHFVDAELAGANLSKVRANDATFKDADLSGADLSEARFEEADMSSADLKGARLRDASMKLTNFKGADLTGADLTGADLSAANFKGADLTGATLDGITANNTIWPTGFAPP